MLSDYLVAVGDDNTVVVECTENAAEQSNIVFTYAAALEHLEGDA